MLLTVFPYFVHDIVLGNGFILKRLKEERDIIKENSVKLIFGIMLGACNGSFQHGANSQKVKTESVVLLLGEGAKAKLCNSLYQLVAIIIDYVVKI
jgi:hypothetical protein